METLKSTERSSSLDCREGHMKKKKFVCLFVSGQRSKVKKTFLQKTIKVWTFLVIVKGGGGFAPPVSKEHTSGVKGQKNIIF
jgi:hypothetical protein